ncbi:hypothetical protein B7Y94_05320 [Candidatus Saccharibacteria bacterium 32-49-12]|nr:MAG: hypothetical protein B7Y94_05320 [Candidatus Saccharibacteria bacterium 32-49-12]
MTKYRFNHRGFSIVELAVVIAIIGLLVLVTVGAYTEYQKRSYDSQMRVAAKQVEEAVHLWYAKTGQQPKGGWSSTVSVSGGNCSDGTGGWFGSTAYVCATEDILVNVGVLPAGFSAKLPKNTHNNASGAYSMMFYPCGSGTKRYALYWHLRVPSAADNDSIAAVEAAGCTAAPRTSYGMKAATLINLN